MLSVVRAGAVDLSKVQIVVLDEADKLFDLEAGKGGEQAEESEEDEEEVVVVKNTKNNSGNTSGSGSSNNKKRKHQQQTMEENEENSEEEEEEHTTTVARIRTSFLSQVDEILADCPDKNVQRALFSATVGSFVRELAESFLNNPIQITIGKENAGATTIDQKLMFVGREDGKLLAIRQIVQAGLRPPVLLFMQSIDRAKVSCSVVIV
mgnify:CR=1 FL=1